MPRPATRWRRRCAARVACSAGCVAAYVAHAMKDFDPRRYPAKPDELQGRVIAITGAGDGVGRAVARACALHGATVVLMGRTVRKLEAVHAELLAAGAPEPSIAAIDLEK